MAKMKCYIKDHLLEGMCTEYQVGDKENQDPATRSDNIVYYIGGYLVQKFLKNRCHCKDCESNIDTGLESLPENFSAHQFTAMKSRGRLRFPSTNLFHLLKIVEEVVKTYTISGQIYDHNAFIDILDDICVHTLPRIGCETHYLTLMTNIVYDYLVIRFKFATKEKSEELCAQSRTDRHTNNKVAKWWKFQVMLMFVCSVYWRFLSLENFIEPEQLFL